MRTQKCSQCGSRLNIAKIEQGTKFACFNCGTILVAGEAPKAVKRSLRGGPVFRPKAGAEETVAVPMRRRGPAGIQRAPKARSNTPMMLGLAAVVVAGVVIAILGSGGGGDRSVDSGLLGGGSASGQSAPSAAQWWSQVGGQLGSASARALRRWLADARAQGYEKDPAWQTMADELYARLIEKAPQDAAANRHFGRQSLTEYPGFEELWARMNDRFKLLPDAAQALLHKYEDRIESGKTAWLDADEYAAAARTLRSFSEWNRKLEADPSLEQIEKGRVRARGELAEFDAGAVVARPFILFVGYRKPPDADLAAERAKRRALGEKVKGALATMAQEFETRFRKPLDLPAWDVKNVLYVWLFDQKADYDAFAAERPLFGKQADLAGSFSVKSRWAYAGLSADANLARDLAHTGVHQLQWFFSKDPKKSYLNHFEEWNGLWFTVGLAAWLGGGVEHDQTSGRTRFTGIDPRRAAQLRTMRDNGLPWVTLRELTQIQSWQGLTRWIRDTWWPQLQGREDVDEQALELIRPRLGAFALQTFYAQAWGLAHFLNEARSGQYRPQYRDLLLTALRGKRKPEKYVTDRLARWRNSYSAFAAIMKLDKEADWQRLEGEYEKHLAELASR